MNVPSTISEHMKKKSEMLNGYIRFISVEYSRKVERILKEVPGWEAGVPFAITAFADVLVYSEDGFIVLYKLVDGVSTILLSDAELLLKMLADEEFQNDYFDMKLFRECVQKLGRLNANQCYTFEPLPSLGGKKAPQNASTGDTLAYISIICS